jgi:putative phosphoribosyl transferase
MTPVHNRVTSAPASPIQKSERSRVVVGGNGCRIGGELTIPAGATGLVTWMVSAASEDLGGHLEDCGLATLELHAPVACSTRSVSVELCFELDSLERQLLQVTRWASTDPRTRQLGLGYLGTGVNAAAALMAAAQLGSAIQAVVCYHSLPEAAGRALGQVKAPTLLIAKSDRVSLQGNRRAYDRLVCRKELVVVSRAENEWARRDMFARIATLATNWFLDHLEPVRRRRCC